MWCLAKDVVIFVWLMQKKHSLSPSRSSWQILICTICLNTLVFLYIGPLKGLKESCSILCYSSSLGVNPCNPYALFISRNYSRPLPNKETVWMLWRKFSPRPLFSPESNFMFIEFVEFFFFPIFFFLKFGLLCFRDSGVQFFSYVSFPMCESTRPSCSGSGGHTEWLQQLLPEPCLSGTAPGRWLPVLLLRFLSSPAKPRWLPR